MENESVNQWLDVASVRALAEELMKPAPVAPKMTPETIYGSGFVGFAESIPVSPCSPVSSVENIPVEAMVAKFVPVPAGADGSMELAPKEVAPKEVAPKEVAPKEEAPREIVMKEPAERVEVTLTPTGKGGGPSQRAVARYPSPFRIATAPPKAPAPAPVPKGYPAEAQGQPLAKRLAMFGVWLKGAIPAEAYFICNRDGEVVIDEIGSSKLIKVACTLAHASATSGGQLGSSAGASSLHVKVSTGRFLEVIPGQCQFGLVILGIFVPQPLSKEAVASITRGFTAALDGK